MCCINVAADKLTDRNVYVLIIDVAQITKHRMHHPSAVRWKEGRKVGSYIISIGYT